MEKNTNTNDDLCNFIMGRYDASFWETELGYVDFPRDGFLVYTEDSIKNQFISLDEEAITNIKKLPTLFAVQEENADTRIGRITDIKIKSEHLRVHFEFDDKYLPLPEGTLTSPDLGSGLNPFEITEIHWEIKRLNISKFLKKEAGKRRKKIEEILEDVKKELDAPLSKKIANKVLLLYARNASGKTQLSKLFYDKYKNNTLRYDAFTEDLFSWNNNDIVLDIKPNELIFNTMKHKEFESELKDNFKKFTGSNVKIKLNIPEYTTSNGEIRFGIPNGDEGTVRNIKISRGEESVFVWSIFYTILNQAIEELNKLPGKRATDVFDKFQYVVIDDPVSSMDDTRILTIALDLAELIKKSKNQLKFLITTHHALFFNVLFRAKKLNKKAYVMSKSDEGIRLKCQKQGSPFAYHHEVISELKIAIAKGTIKRYHYNLFRALLEKTANFLGYSDDWGTLLLEGENKKVFIKKLNHYSHGKEIEIDPKDLEENANDAFKEVFETFMKEFKWGMRDND